MENTFTFQSGDIQIKNNVTYRHVWVEVFTFQSGDIQINFMIVNGGDVFTFTFQSGDIQIKDEMR